jgi:hypothetical protein
MEGLRAAVEAANPKLLELFDGALQAEDYGGETIQPDESRAARQVEFPEGEMHGIHESVRERVRTEKWEPPVLATFCDEASRPGYSDTHSHEYVDQPQTLRKKVRVLAGMLRHSAHSVVYTGAGISTASGIGDYASRSEKSLATGSGASQAYGRRRVLGLHAKPTFAHYALATLYREKLLHHWLQQNHDGLAQKANFPQHALNEIHGAWFDPANVVVPMTGELRPENLHWKNQEARAAELVIALGTSLCGMNSDSVFKTCAKSYARSQRGFGGVLVGFQRSPLDHMCSLRIFAPIEHVMVLLSVELELQVDPTPYSYSPETDAPEECRVPGQAHAFRVPYNDRGDRDESGRTTVWNLSEGTKVRMVDGPCAGFEGQVLAPPSGRGLAYDLQFPSMRQAVDSHFPGQIKARYKLGNWFVEAAIAGSLERLPFVSMPS